MEGKDETLKAWFSARRSGSAVYVHYVKDIRQGALQSDCVILFGGACGPPAGTASYCKSKSKCITLGL